MPQWFFRFSEFPEFTEFNESFVPFRENSSVVCFGQPAVLIALMFMGKSKTSLNRGIPTKFYIFWKTYEIEDNAGEGVLPLYTPLVIFTPSFFSIFISMSALHLSHLMACCSSVLAPPPWFHDSCFVPWTGRYQDQNAPWFFFSKL